MSDGFIEVGFTLPAGAIGATLYREVPVLRRGRRLWLRTLWLSLRVRRWSPAYEWTPTSRQVRVGYIPASPAQAPDTRTPPQTEA